MAEEAIDGGRGEKWWKRREVVEEEIGGGGGDKWCAGMGGEPTDSNTEGAVADTMEAEAGRQLKKSSCRRDAGAGGGAGAGAAAAAAGTGQERAFEIDAFCCMFAEHHIARMSIAMSHACFLV